MTRRLALLLCLTLCLTLFLAACQTGGSRSFIGLDAYGDTHDLNGRAADRVASGGVSSMRNAGALSGTGYIPRSGPYGQSWH